MASSGTWRRVAVVTTDVSEERIASITGLTRIGELGITLSVISNRSMLRRNFLQHDDGGDTNLRKCGSYKSHTVSHPRRRYYSEGRIFVNYGVEEMLQKAAPAYLIYFHEMGRP
jgi:hypothetical protein